MSEESNQKTLPPPWDRIFSLTTRCFVWGLLIAVLYILRPFLLLVFLTFVFAYIQAHGVEGLAHRIKNRPLRVVIVGLVFLGTLFATGFTLLPQVQQQANAFLTNREEYIADADKELNSFLLENLPSVYDGLAKQRALPDLPDPAAAFGPNRPGAIPRQPEPTGEPADGTDANSGANEANDANGANGEQPPPKKPGEPGDQEAADDSKPTPPPELHIVRDLVAGVGQTLAQNPLEIGQSVISYASSFLLSLLFSFLIVLDLRKITRGVKGMKNTKIGFIYDEVADNIAGFGRVLGRALEAQLFIAVCNTILTAIGIWILDLPTTCWSCRRSCSSAASFRSSARSSARHRSR